MQLLSPHLPIPWKNFHPEGFIVLCPNSRIQVELVHVLPERNRSDELSILQYDDGIRVIHRNNHLLTTVPQCTESHYILLLSRVIIASTIEGLSFYYYFYYQ